MRKADDLIIEAIREHGSIKEEEFITEAIVMFACIDPNKPGHHRYGKFFLGESMPAHHAIGLIDTIREMIYDFQLVTIEDDDEDEN